MPRPSAPVSEHAAPARRLAAAVRRRLERAAPDAREVARLEVELGPVDAHAWLAAQPFAERIYWRGRGEAEAVAAVGKADLCAGPADAALARLQERLDALAAQPGAEAVRYFGGLRFAPSGPVAEEWEPFGAAWFLLPRFEMRTDGKAATLACHLVLPADAEAPERVLGEIEALVLDPPALGPALPVPVSRADVPEAAGWRRGVEASLRAFEETALEKVVLARRATFSFDEPLDPFALAERLEAATPGCFHAVIQPEAGAAFVSATPERLLRLEGTRLWSEAVAGTRPRGASAEADAELGEELLLSEKEAREHGYVREHVLAALRPFCAELRIDEAASLMALARGRHLRSAVEGKLRPEARPLDLVRALHPTPAVGGTPVEAAYVAIAMREPFDRGWYAGPIGWVGAEAAEFAVGIRCGLVRGEGLALYSGAGLVAGSDPQAEWEEIELKISDFARVLGLDA